MKRLVALAACFFLAAFLSAPAWAAESSANTALPGTLNYVEGQVSIGSQALNAKSIGSAELQPGQILATANGKAEVLLTPGVFLRIGDNSAVEMISPNLTHTELSLEKGHAMLEVAEIHPENNIRIRENGATTQLLKTGLYDFNQQQDEVRVFDGKAAVFDGEKHVTLKRDHELNLENTDSLKARKFDAKSYEQGDLYRWSSLRSGYLAEANVDEASTYNETPWAFGWWGAGWYWDPWFDAFTFMPGDGIFYSPFGWGFYSPWWVFDAPFYGGYGGWYGGWYGRGYPHYHHQFSTDYHNWGPGTHYVASSHYVNGIYRGPGSIGRGLHSGSAMTMRSGSRGVGRGGAHGGGFHGGGFHGAGGGGFHGGGGGGGGHGR
jgi:hypothetical protein